MTFSGRVPRGVREVDICNDLLTRFQVEAVACVQNFGRGKFEISFRNNDAVRWFKAWPEVHVGKKVSKFRYLGPRVSIWRTKLRDGSCWAVLVVTEIMQRTQALESASEIIILDSTACCDESHATITVVLTATPVGALPIAVLMHNCQTTESYKTAFGLLRQKYPLCFGGLQDAAEVLKQLHEEEWRFYSLAADNPHYTALEQVLAEMKKVHKEPQVMASYFAQKAAFASARRRGRLIKVQPTGIARL
ncbi:hypothetical protein MRX96_048158 [Rhipicephalus microplus]